MSGEGLSRAQRILAPGLGFQTERSNSLNPRSRVSRERTLQLSRSAIDGSGMHLSEDDVQKELQNLRCAIGRSTAYMTD